MAWAVAKTKPVRIGSILVDMPELNFGVLDVFLAKTRVFPSFSRRDLEQVRPFLEALKQAGFQVSTDEDMMMGEDFRKQIREELELAARDGWVLVFLSGSSLNSPAPRCEAHPRCDRAHRTATSTGHDTDF